jgi:hypothetical protein
MHRVNLSDRSGHWFDREKSRCFAEKTSFDGHNHVSITTGDQWEHEEVYRTHGGKYILHSWSQWQGAEETYQSISQDEAFSWLLVNGHDDAIPHKVVVHHEI